MRKQNALILRGLIALDRRDEGLQDVNVSVAAAEMCAFLSMSDCANMKFACMCSTCANYLKSQIKFARLLPRY